MPCSMCGECCKYLVFTATNLHLNQDALKYYTYRKIRIEKVGRTGYRFIIYSPCDKLTKDNKCSIWENRPEICDYRKSSLAVWKPPECTDK